MNEKIFCLLIERAASAALFFCISIKRCEYEKGNFS